MANTTPTGSRLPSTGGTSSAPASTAKLSPNTRESVAPTAVFRLGDVSAAVFHDELGTLARANISLRRTNRGEDGRTNYVHTLRSIDLPAAINVLQKALNFLSERIESPPTTSA